ncbi:MAG: epoxyqueuosine reductase QueH [Oscillospiraceae bacterium]|nr:epoxyqueuosine reductase QueH [Oscillospiraceae bacterium]MDD4368539.1 epoxyqueuosine reductase QueH [Oscillospiraceae bacterium]
MSDKSNHLQTQAVRTTAPERLLLHMCCGPCAEYPLEQLRQQGYQVSGYFYNPNIHPQQEWETRLANVRRLAELKNLTVYENSDYREQQWRDYGCTARSGQCQICYALRMNEAARFAAQRGYKLFTTSLLVSPYQNYEAIVRTASLAARRYGVSFLKQDFRPGYRKGQEMAKADGLYRQKYCGCIFSLGETNPKYRDRYLERFGLNLAELPQRLTEQ